MLIFYIFIFKVLFAQEILLDGNFSNTELEYNDSRWKVEDETTIKLTEINNNEEILSSTVSLHKEIVIVEENEDLPTFQNLPYIFTVNETTPTGSQIYNDILVTDYGNNRASAITLHCDAETTPEACNKFAIETEKINENEYRGIISLQEPLDYDTTSTYILAIKAEDLAKKERPIISAIIVAEVSDEQDLGPQFSSDTYQISVQEESNEEKIVLTLEVNDGDRGSPRPLLITLENEMHGYFKIDKIQNDSSANYFVTISTTTKPINREDKDILWLGGLYVFQIKATELENGNPNNISSSANIWVTVIDVNDNPPLFDRSNITVNLPENYTVGLSLPGFYSQVDDADTGENAKFNLSLVTELTAFENYFKIEPTSAQTTTPVTLTINEDTKLDYEDLQSREIKLLIIASDNSGQSSSQYVTILLQDSNDNQPIFDREEYKAQIQLQNVSDSLVVVLNATDKDSGTFGSITYEMLGKNTDKFLVDPHNGSVFMIPCSEVCIPQNYQFVVKATDGGGKFTLANLIINTELPSVNTTVEIVANTTEKIQFTNSVYNATIREITKEGTDVIRLSATNSNPESKIIYSILNGAENNFDMDPTEGILRVAPGAILDIDHTQMSDYNITVKATYPDTDEGSTLALTYISIEDVNNKPPHFDRRFYIVNVDGRKNIGDEIFQLTALDSDNTAELKYSIDKRIIFLDKIGNVSAETQSIIDVLQINSSTGSIVFNSPLWDYSAILLTAFVEDVAAQTPGQSDSADVIIFVTGSSNEFSWKLPKSTIELIFPEDIPIGSQIILLGEAINRDDLIFEKIEEPDTENYFNVNPETGSITTIKSLDYEILPESKQLMVNTTVILSGQNIGNISVVLNILDINDNQPTFTQKTYNTSVKESIEDYIELLRLIATDLDSGEFGKITYRLSEDNNAFDITKEGILFKKQAFVLDREKYPIHILKVFAIDNENDENDQRIDQTTIFIDVEDVNDHAPTFKQNSYTIVIPETLLPNTWFFQVQAFDLDTEENSIIKYSLVNSNEMNDFLAIHNETGMLFTTKTLSGVGRSIPYHFRVEATDMGSPSLSSNCEIEIHVGDLTMPDELPQFLSPPSGEIIFIQESDTEDLTVCQVELALQNRFQNMKRVVRFSLLDQGYGGSYRRFFTINTDTGLVTTRRPLDRETMENYTLVIAATQVGPYVPQAYRIVRVSVTDVNDNPPYFPRPLNSDALEMSVFEESEPGTSVGTIEAVDPDKGENAVMVYSIIGDEELKKYFAIKNTQDGKGLIYVKDRLDHEKQTFYDLTVQVRNPNDAATNDNSYDPSDLSRLKVRINLIDIDDNNIQFVSPTDNLGVRLNAPRQSIITTIQAYDPDASDNPLQYFIEKVTFKKDGEEEVDVNDEMFYLEKDSGVLRTAQNLLNYEDGTFYLVISGRSARKTTSIQETKIKIRVLHDSHMLKFIFQKPPNEVQKDLRNINRDLQNVVDIPQPVTLQLADTQLNIKDDSFINADSTNVCFQMVKDKLPIHLTEAQSILDSNGKPSLEKFYKTYNISHIGPCDQIHETYQMNWIEIFTLVISALISVATVISIIFLFWLRKKR